MVINVLINIISVTNLLIPYTSAKIMDLRFQKNPTYTYRTAYTYTHNNYFTFNTLKILRWKFSNLETL